MTPYDELAAYTLGLGDEAFIHQHVVDAWAVQHARAGDPPIVVAQALVGLYLHVEHGMSGRQVQRVHVLLADQRPAWPAFALPHDRGALSAGDVLSEPPGPARDRAIDDWATTTWRSCRALTPQIEAFLAAHGITPPRSLSDEDR